MVSGRQNVITGVLPADFHPQLVSAPAFVAAGAGDIDVYRANVIRPSTGPGVGTFALSALLLVIVGIYGVVAYAVAQRTQKIGLRIALGAARGQVVAMVVRQGMAITLGGITLGVAAALASTQVMIGLLYEVTPTDFATFAAAIATVGATAFAACCGPAVEASLIDPLVALRCE